MKRQKIVLCAVLVSLAALTGCGGSSGDLPDLSSLGKINVIGREEGSGTKASLEDLLGIDSAVSGSNAASTEEMMEDVGKDRSAIGYAALDALSGGEQVKALKVGGVTPSSDTVKSRKYPLTRNYYLAWQGNLTDAEQEFLTYVLGAGQATVAKEAVPVGKETGFLSLKPKGTFEIEGSTSMAPLLEQLAADYEALNPNAAITVTATDSTQGLRDAMQGKTDIAMSSRNLKDYEKELLSSRAIASDAIVLIVNSENPLDNLKLSQAKDIFSGTVGNWKDL